MSKLINENVFLTYISTELGSYCSVNHHQLALLLSRIGCKNKRNFLKPLAPVDTVLIHVEDIMFGLHGCTPKPYRVNVSKSISQLFTICFPLPSHHGQTKSVI